eukprot:CAMPEP_0201629074 /NCGR_PEP_ID=MMETSP0493-20130528/3843_1 /ASSEMBLY_ACC=CAM_ASM_000838 /TAXON_ID=420259 /ORGANISM="Thalassiosira gravida, Strain GMp14c1" /LENGTH=448 /DNA_ID=CAMNT_0048099983 /DNA_START=59 /DNA_END=1406 /DNA_ORIENTATION=-
MMDLKLTTAPPVTPHELDAWLRTTEVDDDEKDDTPLVPTHPLRQLSSSSSSSSQPPVNDESSGGDYGRGIARRSSSSKLQQRGYRRRSSLDCKPGSSDSLVDKSFFGIDEITLLSANSKNNYSANNDQGGVEIEAKDWRLVSDTSLLGSIGIGDDNADATKDDTRCHRRVSSPLSSNKTCVSTSTVPDRNGFRRSVSCPHGHGDDENICAAAEGSISPVPVDDSSPGQYYCRSLSLPSEHDNGQRSRHDATGDGVAPISPRSPNHHTGRNHHNESVGSLANPSHYFISAMERSRVSQDCIERRFLNNSSQRDMATMRDSAESRAVLLRIMLRSGNTGGDIIVHVVTVGLAPPILPATIAVERVEDGPYFVFLPVLLVELVATREFLEAAATYIIMTTINQGGMMPVLGCIISNSFNPPMTATAHQNPFSVPANIGLRSSCSSIIILEI